ncbi:MAG: diacylglycerol kinase family protein [Ginsengibacter sp.]
MRFLKSFKYALQGIRHCSVSEKNFRIQLVIAAITFLFGIALRISPTEWLAILFCSALVLGLEMVNTTIEKLSDTITKSIDPVIKQVKDIAAGAVCLVSVISFIIGCIIFLPKIQPFSKYFTK